MVILYVSGIYRATTSLSFLKRISRTWQRFDCCKYHKQINLYPRTPTYHLTLNKNVIIDGYFESNPQS